ncbi:MAG: PASTA domain-containing protein, partial [Actinobacteria bacterium]
ERTINRKIKEAVLAYELEKRYPKKKILEKYINTVYFSHGNYGIETAAEAFFGKKVEKLKIEESALLAGLIRSPQRYSPWNHKDKALARRNLVLTKMRELGYISKIDTIKIKARPLKIKPPKPERRYPGAYFVEHVRHQMLTDKRFGETEQDRANNLYKGGLRIYTTISLSKQQMADNAIQTILNRSGDPSASLVSIDPKTGKVLAIAGGRDFFDQKNKHAKFNLATQSKRQTGSSFKVFVLTTAITQGITPYKTIDSSPGTLSLPGGGTWRVDNYTEGRGYGRITIRQGTIQSVNALYARLMLDVGAKNVVRIAKKMGIKSKLSPNPAIALGGLKYGVNAYEMASAMATLANEGTYIEPKTISKITDSNKKIIFSNKPRPKLVISPTVASTVTSILKDVMTRGTGRGANIGRPAAGKTGTAQSYRDAWFIGYTPDMATAVWVGHPHAQVAMLSVHGRRVTGGSFPASIWRQYMKEALAKTPKSKFPYSKYASRERTVQICNGTTDMQACNACPPGSTYSKTLHSSKTVLRQCNMHECEEETSKVPKVVGLSAKSAVRKLNAAGFEVVKKRKDSSRPTNIVLSQSPAGGTKVKRIRTVVIYISQKIETTTVPSVVGQSESEAASTLSSAGFKATVSYQSNPDQVGIVISQSPAGGSQAEENSIVSLIVGSQ